MKLTPNGEVILTVNRFTLEDAKKFASFSGDSNPLHIDPVIARRSIAGDCILHGIFGAMWCLDKILDLTDITPKSLSIRFLKPVYLYTDIELRLNQSLKEIYLMSEGVKLYVIEYKVGENGFDLSPEELEEEIEIIPPIKSPNILTFLECSSRKIMDFVFQGESEVASEIFPNIYAKYGRVLTCEFATISKIVGMEVPGLNSLFLTCKIELGIRNYEASNFSVIDADSRFKLIQIEYRAKKIMGNISALYLPISRTGIAMNQIEKQVLPGIFNGINALIIGGSRGLGEIVAKVLTTGGGKVTLTYNLGHSDAMNLQNEIATNGRDCQIAYLNINDSSLEKFNLEGFNQIYYFATPRIIKEGEENSTRTEIMSYKIFYLSAFEEIVERVAKQSRKTSIFYPSTDFINNPNPGFEVYSNIKLQGEVLCQKLSDLHGIKIIFPRLPRFDTDQTRGLFESDFVDPIETILPLLQNMT